MTLNLGDYCQRPEIRQYANGPILSMPYSVFINLPIDKQSELVRIAQVTDDNIWYYLCMMLYQLYNEVSASTATRFLRQMKDVGIDPYAMIEQKHLERMMDDGQLNAMLVTIANMTVNMKVDVDSLELQIGMLKNVLEAMAECRDACQIRDTDSIQIAAYSKALIPHLTAVTTIEPTGRTVNHRETQMYETLIRALLTTVSEKPACPMTARSCSRIVC